MYLGKDTNSDVESQPCTCTSSSNVSDNSRSTTESETNLEEKEKWLSQCEFCKVMFCFLNVIGESYFNTFKKKVSYNYKVNLELPGS